MNRITRRMFTRLMSATAAAASLPAGALASASSKQNAAGSRQADISNMQRFPEGFHWGSATASYQVEGAVKDDGRGPSVWDTFSHTPGKVANGDTGDVADDHYHRYPEDIALMKGMGMTSYRFSIAWSRVFPTGSGTPNPRGLDFYSRMVDTLLASGIEPYGTLFHWDLPQALQDKGGWENPDVAKAFADYAGYVAEKLGDRVRHIMTMNEIRTFVELGYENGTHAPGLRLNRARVAQLNHYAVLGHGLAVKAIRAARPGVKVGLADNAVPTCPVIESPEHIAAAHKAFREVNAQYLAVIMDGRYTDLYLRRLGADAPKFTAEEMATISQPLDFVGLNVYNPMWVRAADNIAGFEMIQDPPSYPHMFSPWLSFGPEGLYWSPRIVTDLWGIKELYITENGCSSTDTLTAKGEVLDTDRVMFLRNYLTQLHRAVSEGVPVKGYFLWSLLDNFEWADGYSKRFGIHYVDFATQKRTAKLSAHFYKEVIARNGLA